MVLARASLLFNVWLNVSNLDELARVVQVTTPNEKTQLVDSLWAKNDSDDEMNKYSKEDQQRYIDMARAISGDH